MGSTTKTPFVASARGDVCIADGYGITINVHRGRLIVRDGIGRQRRERSFPRVRPGISRLVVLGRAGTISLEAIRWLTDLGISYVHLDRDGTVLATSTPSTGDVRIRRIQARAPLLPVGLELTRQILRTKVQGQHENLTVLPYEVDAASGALDRLVQDIQEATTLHQLLTAEREAALVYWSAWSSLELSFARRDLDHLADHWRTFDQRQSPISKTPRVAINPANALLNFLYAVLAAETRIACITVGLDPTLGLFHVDYRSRDSFVYDLMEVARPEVDRYVLDLIRHRTFSRHDFVETTRGQCRVRAPLSHALAETASAWRDTIAPHAEGIAARLAAEPDSRIETLSTPLTRSNYTNRTSRSPRLVRTRKPAVPERNCKRCGGNLPTKRRTYCDDCLPIFQREQLESGGARPPSSARLASARTTHGGAVAAKRGATNVARKREARDWDHRFGKLTDLSAFEREVLPKIQPVSLSRLVRSTGLSLRYVSQIRRGEKIPHPRHWQSLLEAVEEDSGLGKAHLRPREPSVAASRMRKHG